MFFELYSYQNCFEVLYVDGLLCSNKVNYPMNRKEIIKLHRGVDNIVQFNVKNRDYKNQNIDHLSVKAKLTNKQNSELMLEKYLTHGECKGSLNLNIFEGDLIDIPSGFYELVIQGEDNISPTTPDLIVAQPLYNNQSSDIAFDVEVTNQGNANPVPSVELTPKTWIPINAAEEPYSLVSPAISANAIRNHKNSIHTFVLYSTQFTGNLQIFGSLDINPPTDLTQYFEIEITPGSTQINFEDFTGIEPFTIQSNLVWVKFKLVYSTDIEVVDNGCIDKILWRS